VLAGTQVNQLPGLSVCLRGCNSSRLFIGPGWNHGSGRVVIAGEGDPLFHREYINKNVLPATPGARVVFLPCGHEIPFEMPNETGSLLEAFLAGLHCGTIVPPAE
jgi:hypothetical protein